MHDHLLAGLKSRRQSLGMRGSEIAKRLGMTYNNYMRYESGDTVPNAHKLKHIADLLGCTPNDLYRLPDSELPAYGPDLAAARHASSTAHLRADTLKVDQLPDEELVKLMAAIQRRLLNPPVVTECDNDTPPPPLQRPAPEPVPPTRLSSGVVNPPPPDEPDALDELLMEWED